MGGIPNNILHIILWAVVVLDGPNVKKHREQTHMSYIISAWRQLQ